MANEADDVVRCPELGSRCRRVHSPSSIESREQLSFGDGRLPEREPGRREKTDAAAMFFVSHAGV